MLSEKKKKVLLIKLSSLGDVIFNIPLANALKDSGYEVSWLVSEKGVQVVKNNPCVDKTFFVPLEKWKKHGFSFSNFMEYLSIIKELRKEKFDIAIDAQMMMKSLFWLLFCGAKRRIISKEAKEFSAFGGNEFVEGISYKPSGSIVMNYLKYAKHLGIDVEPENIKVTLPQRDNEKIKKVDDFFKNLDMSKPVVTIAPATTWENKHWNKDNWRNVVDYLFDKTNLVFTGGAKDAELIEYISNGRGLNLAGKTDISELIEVFSRSNLVIAPDSGSTHLAWAIRNPKVITIFTCTPKDILGPLGSSDKYVSLGGTALICQPCFKRKCKLKNKKLACTFIPTTEEVIEQIEKFLA